MTIRVSVLTSAAAAILICGVRGAAVAADFPSVPTKAVPSIGVAPFFTLTDNRLTYSYLPGGSDPGVPGKTAKQIVSFTHFDVWAYGTNLLGVNLLKSDRHDPAAPCPVGGATGCEGATEFFGFVRSTFGFNQVFQTNSFTWGPLRNVSLEVGADGETGE